jgi:hypothetical protein
MKQAFKVQLIGVNTHPVELTQVSSVQTVLSLQGAFGALKQYRGGKPNRMLKLQAASSGTRGSLQLTGVCGSIQNWSSQAFGDKLQGKSRQAAHFEELNTLEQEYPPGPEMQLSSVQGSESSQVTRVN